MKPTKNDKPIFKILNPQRLDLVAHASHRAKPFDSKLNDNTFNMLKMRWFNTFEVAQFFRFVIALNWVRKHFSKRKKEYRVIMDFGCSHSQLYTFWRNNGNYFGWPKIHYYGVDANIDGLEPELPHKANDEYYTVFADLSSPLEMPEKADAIICMEILEHIQKIKAPTLLYNIRKNLRKDGIAILSSPNPLKHCGEEFAWKDSNESHHYEWSSIEAKKLFRECEFIIEEFCGIMPRRGVFNNIEGYSSLEDTAKELEVALPYSFWSNMLTTISPIAFSKQWMMLLRKEE